MMFARTRLPLVAAALAVIVPSFAASFAVAAEAEIKQTPFVAALMTNWSAWDADKDDTLTSTEIDRAAADPAVKGDAAAAAAALKQLSRSTKSKLPTLTKAYFEQYSRDAAPAAKKESAADAETATVDPGTSAASIVAESKGPAINWDRNFLASKARIDRKGSGPIWPASLNAASMRQGPIGDCFYVAVVGSLAMRDPARIQQIVTPVGEGQFRAAFPNSEPFTFAAPTDATLAGSGTTTDDGAWLAVMEQAYGKHRSRAKGGSLDIDGTEIIRSGGDSIPTIEGVTGHKAKRISIAHTLEQRAAEADAKLPEIRKMIQESIKSGRISVIGLLPPSAPRAPRTTAANGDGPTTAPTTAPAKSAGTPPTYPKAIVKKHVYAVVGYDAATDMLEVWNPHGNTFNPSGPEGLVNGYKTEKGRFKLPLTDAYKFYTAFTFETAEPVAPKVAAAK